VTMIASSATPTSIPATSTLAPATQTPTSSISSPTVTSPVSTPTVVPPTATLQPIIEKIYDDKDNGFVYSPSWVNISKSQAYKRSYKLTTQNGSFVTFGFTGRSFSILYESGTAFRMINVYVDGLLMGTINEKTSKSIFQRRWDFPGTLTSGSHTLKLVFVTTDTSNKTSGSLDAVIVR